MAHPPRPHLRLLLAAALSAAALVTACLTHPDRGQDERPTTVAACHSTTVTDCAPAHDDDLTSAPADADTFAGWPQPPRHPTPTPSRDHHPQAPPASLSASPG